MNHTLTFRKYAPSPQGIEAKLSWANIAILLSIFQFLVTTCLTCVVFANTYHFFIQAFGSQSNAGSQPIILVYFSLFILGNTFQVWLSINAASHRNTTQVIATVVFNIILFFYSIAQFFQNKTLQDQIKFCADQLIRKDQLNPEDIKKLRWCPKNLHDFAPSFQTISSTTPFLISIIIIMFVMNTIASVIAVYVHRDYGWTLVRLNGACLQTKLVLNRFHLFILLLKLNIFHFVCVLAEYVCGTIYLKRQYELEIELPLDGAGLNNDMSNLLIPYAVLMSVVFIFYYYFGIEGVQKANIIATVLFLLLTLLIVSINSYLMYVVFNEVEFEFMWISFSLFSGVNIIINIATFIVAVYCIKDFGKEGRAKVFKKMTIPIGATDCQLRPRMEIE